MGFYLKNNRKSVSGNIILVYEDVMVPKGSQKCCSFPVFCIEPPSPDNVVFKKPMLLTTQAR